MTNSHETTEIHNLKDLTWDYKALEDAAIEHGRPPHFLYGLAANHDPVTKYAHYIANLSAGADTSHDVKFAIARWLNAHANLANVPGATVSDVARKVLASIRK